MSLLSKLAIRNILLNKKRSTGIIIGIILSVALIVTVSGLTASLLKSMIQNQVSRDGDYHIQLYYLSNDDVQSIEANRDFNEISLVSTIGYSEFNYGYRDFMNHLSIQSFIKGSPQDLGYELIEGEFATNKDELVLTVGAASDSGYKVGDTIEIEMGIVPEFWEGPEIDLKPITSHFTITGIVSHLTYSDFYYGFTRDYEANNYTSYLKSAHLNNYQQDIAELLGIDNFEQTLQINDGRYKFYSINYELLAWEAFDFSDGTLRLIMAVVSILVFIIITSSVFSIRNSFSISTTEKLKMLGMLSSVGATKTQIKKQVLIEAFILGVAGIPIGILSGILFHGLFIRFINTNLVEVLNGFNIPFTLSWQGILIAVLLGFLTIYLSARSSIRRVGKVSPIEQLRGSEEIKISAKKLKTPKVIYRFFGMGGVIANKNMKRSSRKYRTTVISLTVSIFAFISLSSFSSRAILQTTKALGKSEFSLHLDRVRNLTQEELLEIEEIKGVNSMKITYILDGNPYIDLDGQDVLNTGIDPEFQNLLGLVALEENYFQEYAQELEIDSSYKGGILYDVIETYDDDRVSTSSRAFTYESNDSIHGLINNKEIEIQVQIPTTPRHESSFYNIYTSYVLLNKSVFEDAFEYIPFTIDINADDNTPVIEKINQLSPQTIIYDYQAEVHQSTLIIQLVSVFVYGLILVITLIGVTNIFNTITSNFALRQSEFAMLRSVGMTQAEFNQMINLETIFYSTKSLAFGILLGILGSLAIQSAFNSNPTIKSSLDLPIFAIILAIIFVFLITFVIMRYSISKMKHQNIIETIRKANH